MEKAANKFTYNNTAFGADFVMEVVSNKEVSVEGCRGVAEYGENYIKLNAGKGSVTLFGTKFQITRFLATGLTIIGNVERIEFCM